MHTKKDALGDRMKENYEVIPRNFLVRRVPVIMRLDGKAAHTFTRGLKRPFDDVFMKSMQETMKYLCESIQGCVLGYTQSDEITLVLRDDFRIETCAWFDYNVQKMTSISASMATLAFNRAFNNAVEEYIFNTITDGTENISQDEKDYIDTLNRKRDMGLLFDSRVFNIPKFEVNNCLIWRQQDATRNSILSVGYANFSHKKLENLNCGQIQDKLFTEKGINWNDYPSTCKRGSCCIKIPMTVNSNSGEEITRNKWYIDNEIPIFTQDRTYVEGLM